MRFRFVLILAAGFVSSLNSGLTVPSSVKQVHESRLVISNNANQYAFTIRPPA